MTNGSTNLAWYFYIGLIAAVCIAVYMMPQMIKTIKTKDTVGVSIIMLILAVVGDSFFVINGIGVMADKSNAQRIAAGLPIFLGNLFGLIATAITGFFKIRNMYMSKKMNMTEKDFCSNWKNNVEVYKRNFSKKDESSSSADKPI